MKKKNLIILLIAFLLFGLIGYAQVVNPVPSFPPNFSYTLPIMPAPQSSTQIFLGSCKYIFPIELKNVKVFSATGNSTAPIVDAQIILYTNNKNSACSWRKTYTLPLSLTTQDLINNLNSAISSELISQANANTQPSTEPNPISTGT